ncbi:hypothetical protein EZS27_036299 [termite gut metagenome]|uniref:Uncharacterized protein n=1 Tax=termite gut metagenome TaxID=433724 RepID=A0A5J4PWZ8_9ZZZZ
MHKIALLWLHLPKVMLEKILIQIIPTKKTSKATLFSVLILPALKSKYPINKLNNAHKTLVRGDESPTPEGVANGVGKESPEIPFMKCGTAFVKNPPAKNAAM